jgi:hypothetical protein
MQNMNPKTTLMTPHEHYKYLRERLQLTKEKLAAERLSRVAIRNIYIQRIKSLNRRIRELREKYNLREFKKRDTLKPAKAILAERIRMRKEGLL